MVAEKDESVTGSLSVTVVTVCRNAAKCIQENLSSVAGQTHRALEHLIIDGASTDGTQDIVRAASHAPFLLSEPDKGIYDAMNKGLRLATGDLVLYLNADDRFADPDAITRLVTGWIQAKHARGGDSRLVVYGDHILEYYDLDVRRSVVGRQDFRGGMRISHQALLIPACVYDEVGSYDVTWRLAADLDLAIRIETAGIPYVRIPGPVSVFRKGGASDISVTASYREASAIIRGHYGWLGSRRFVLLFWRTKIFRSIGTLIGCLGGDWAHRLLRRFWASCR